MLKFSIEDSMPKITCCSQMLTPSPIFLQSVCVYVDSAQLLSYVQLSLKPHGL